MLCYQTFIWISMMSWNLLQKKRCFMWSLEKNVRQITCNNKSYIKNNFVFAFAAHQASQRRGSPWLSPTPFPVIQLSQLTTCPFILKMAKTAIPRHWSNGLKASLKKAALQKKTVSNPSMSAHQTRISAPAAPTHPRGSRYVTLRTVTGAQGVRVQMKQKQNPLRNSQRTLKWSCHSQRLKVKRWAAPLILQRPVLSRSLWVIRLQRRPQPSLHLFQPHASPSTPQTNVPSYLLVIRRRRRMIRRRRKFQRAQRHPRWEMMKLPIIHLAFYTRYTRVLWI